ncbi:hypothetical protein JTB14_028718 [Gonioctena quinquepunctata]|nr:hypothetical protein JTB14_028718 [Gonioctena quinquepunctata]
MSEGRKLIVHEEIHKLSEAGVITTSTSELCSPVVLVPEKDGKLRFCLGQAKIFSSLDLRNGFWQAPVSEKSRKYTAFGDPDGTVFEFKILSFGLRNGPAAFQKLMGSVLSGYTDTFCKVYLDDVIVYSNSVTEHFDHLQLVLERLRIHGLWLSPSKCRLGKKELDYLGRVVSKEGNKPQGSSMVNIVDFPTPMPIRQVRGFLGTAGWLREYIPNFSGISAPLTDLIDKSKRFKWTEESDQAFSEIKRIVANPLELARPNQNIPLSVQTDASHVGIGEVLFQEGPNGQRNIIAYASC